MPAKKPPTQKVSAIQRMIGSLIVLGTVLGMPVGAEPMVVGQVRMFDLSDLQRGPLPAR